MAKIALVRYTFVFEPAQTFAHLYEFENKLGEVLKLNGLQAEVIESGSGAVTDKTFYLSKIEEVPVLVPPEEPIKGPQQAIKDLKKGLK